MDNSPTWKRERQMTFVFYLMTWFSMGLESTMIFSTLWTDKRNTKNTNTKNMDNSPTWKRERQMTFIFYLMTWFSMGLESTMIFSTLWTYINTTIKPDNPHLSYGLIFGGRYLLPLCISFPVTRWFDKTRKLRLTTVLTSILVSTGFALYLLPFSVYLPLLGRIFCGTIYLVRAILNSELFRIYDEADVPSCFAMATCAYAIGEIIGPLILMLSEHVNVWFGKLHIVYGNLPSLIMLFFSIIRIIMSFWFVYELPMRKTPKISMTQTNEDEELSENKNQSRSIKIDSCILIVQQFFSTALGTNFIPCVAPFLIETLHYGKLGINLFYLGGSLFMIIISIVAKTINVSNNGVFRAGLASLTSLLCSYLIITLLALMKDLKDPFKIVLLLLLTFCYGISYIGEVTYIPITLGNISHTSHQSTVEGIRMSSKLIGGLLGSVITPYAYKNLIYVFPLFMMILTSFIFVNVARKGTLLVKKS